MCLFLQGSVWFEASVRDHLIDTNGDVGAANLAMVPKLPHAFGQA